MKKLVDSVSFRDKQENMTFFLIQKINIFSKLFCGNKHYNVDGLRTHL